MYEILITVFPVFLLLAAGFASVRTGYMPDTVASAINAFTVRLAVPVLLFDAMRRLDFQQAFQLPMLFSFYFGALACFVAGILISRRAFGRKPGESVSVGFTAMFSNTVLMGIPIASRAYGDATLASVYGIVALHVPLIYAIGISTMEWARRDGRGLLATARSALVDITANPLMIGILAGLACNGAGIELPGPIQETVGMLSAAAIPSALFGLGAALTQYRMKSELAESLYVTALSLILHPLIALLLAHYAFSLPADQVRAAVVMASMPPGINGYVFATMYLRAQALSASAILVAKLLSIATIAGWLAVLNLLVPAG